MCFLLIAVSVFDAHSCECKHAAKTGCGIDEMNMTGLTLDIIYFAVFVLGDFFRWVAMGLIVAATWEAFLIAAQTLRRG